MNTISIGGVEVLVHGEAAHPASVMLLLHGRGASAASILGLTEHLTLSSDTLVIAPDAPGHQWYPERFIVPKADNEPFLSNSLTTVDTLMNGIVEQFNLSTEQIFLAGFSQGACLVSEYLKQYPTRYHGATIMSGGVIGTDNEALADIAEGSLSDTPVYLGCDTEDFHIPVERVKTTASLLTKQGADVDLKLYDELGHTVHQDALQFIEKYL